MINMTTAEAAARLGVKPATLYAYVSRGLLTRTRTRGGSRFDAAEVERLALGGRRARTPAPLGFVTALTLVEGGRYRYRGLDAVELSRTRRFEDVAAWLWLASWPEQPEPWEATAGTEAVAEAAAAVGPHATPAERWRVAVAAAAAADPLRHDRHPPAVAAAARGLLAALVEVLPVAAVRPPAAAVPDSLAARLWARLSPLPATAAHVAVLDAALVLLADHELAASTLAARTAASFGADPYNVVLAGMAAASGPLHAASSLEVRPVLARARANGPAVALGEVLRRGSAVHGFGQPLYPDGDPRATELLGRLRGLLGPLDGVDGLLSLAARRGMPPPNVDLALAALAEATLMVPGASEAIFVLARSAGWVAHALEEYAGRTSFRLRASYVGPR
ncbi:MAG: citrate/2-methylcitrate synthase [Acidimicrobiales bacterium]